MSAHPEERITGAKRAASTSPAEAPSSPRLENPQADKPVKNKKKRLIAATTRAIVPDCKPEASQATTCRGAKNPRDESLNWLNALLAILCRLPEFMDLLLASQSDDPIVAGIKAFHGAITNNKDGDARKLVRALEATGLIDSQLRRQDPPEVFGRLVRYLDAVTGHKFSDLFMSTVLYDETCAPCGRLKSSGVVERLLWDVEDPMTGRVPATSPPQSQPQSLSQSQSQSPDQRAPGPIASQPVSQLRPDQSQKLSGEELYLCGFHKPASSAYCQACAGETETIAIATKVSHGPILILHQLHSNDPPFPNIDISAHFSDLIDNGTPWEVAALMLYHPSGTKTKTETNAHYSAIVHHGEWAHINDSKVGPVGARLADHKMPGRLTPFAKLMIYTKRAYGVNPAAQKIRDILRERELMGRGSSSDSAVPQGEERNDDEKQNDSTDMHAAEPAWVFDTGSPLTDIDSSQ